MGFSVARRYDHFYGEFEFQSFILIVFVKFIFFHL
jgi:hypothetical protein